MFTLYNIKFIWVSHKEAFHFLSSLLITMNFHSFDDILCNKSETLFKYIFAT